MVNPAVKFSCVRLTGVVGPVDATNAHTSGVKVPAPTNNYADVLLIQRLINAVVDAGYMDQAVLGGGNGKLGTRLAENGTWSLPLQNAIKQIELLYFHGRANPHGIAVIDPQADESLFVFLVNLANGSQKAKQQLSVQMKALAVAMIPSSRVMTDAGGTAPDGTKMPAKMEAVDLYLPILLDALTQKGLRDTDMVLVALACVFTETNNFVPISEKMYDLNTTGTFTNNATGATWTDNPAGVHKNYGLLKQHYNAALKANPKFPLRGTETFTPNTLGPDGSTVKGNIYDHYVDSDGVAHDFNGNHDPGDGWKYRGRGLIQLTGKGLYAAADKNAKTGTLFQDDPDQVNSQKYAGIVVAGFLLAAEPRIRNDLKRDDLAAVRKVVNGGTNGIENFKKAMAAGRRVIAQDIILQAKASVRKKRTAHPKRGAGAAKPSASARGAK